MSEHKNKLKIDKWLATRDEKTNSEEFLREIREQIKTIQNQAEFKKKLKYYSAMGNEIRFTIIRLLEEKALCTCVLSSIFDLKESTISHHLKILETAGLIIGLKKGSFIMYHTRENILKELKQ